MNEIILNLKFLLIVHDWENISEKIFDQYNTVKYMFCGNFKSLNTFSPQIWIDFVQK